MANEKRLIEVESAWEKAQKIFSDSALLLAIRVALDKAPAVEVVHGSWVLTAHEEYSNFRWNVTAECSECHHDKGEIYAGFFPGFPKDLARNIVLDCAKRVKLDNYCPNCGAKMDGDGNA